MNPSKSRRSQNSVEEGFLSLLRAFFELPARVVIVADRGSGRATFLALVEGLFKERAA